MKVGEFMLEFDVIVGVTADIAGPAGSSANVMERVFHRADNIWMLPHAEIIVRAPNGYVFGTIVSRKATRVGITALISQDVDEYAIAAFRMKSVNRLFENSVIIHGY